MSSIHKSGSCLCGSVKLSIALTQETCAVCHCGMCRKWGGGPAVCTDNGKITITSGEDWVSVFKSSPWGERGFCKKCGSHLFFRTQDQSFCNVPMGLLDGVDDFKMNLQIFIDRKPKYYELANATEKMTEKQVMEKFGE